MTRTIAASALYFVMVLSAHTAAETVNVITSGFGFISQDVGIKVGDSVHWSVLAFGFHNVVEVASAQATSSNGGFRSPAGVDEYTHVFETSGDYYYICEPHISFEMRGRIRVREVIPPVPASSVWGLLSTCLAIIVLGAVVLKFKQNSKPQCAPNPRAS